MTKSFHIFWLLVATIFLAESLYKASIGLPLTGWAVWLVSLNTIWAMLSLAAIFGGEGR